MRILSLFLLLFLVCLFSGCSEAPHDERTDVAAAEEWAPDTGTVPGRWSPDRIAQYVSERPWVVGANYNNRGAINQLEMWQATSFDTAQINEELGWAASIGMNSMRVYLHNLLWEQDSLGFLDRMETYLTIADRHGISTTFVLFDSVWNPESSTGPQPAPIPHTHNSGWVQSPPERQLTLDQEHFPTFRTYVQGVLNHFREDERIYAWDLYNEPDNHNFGKFAEEQVSDKEQRVFPLLRASYEWARKVAPSQPLTTGVWFGDLFHGDGSLNTFNTFQLNNSDVISYHFYGSGEAHADFLPRIEEYQRPLLCTEYMARTNGSTFANTLPLLAERNIGAYNWGLVSGKSQTIYPWVSWDSTFVAEPHRWFHDVFHPDGTPYDPAEATLISALSTEKNDKQQN
ncbi:1,4-beta-xylanase [Lewinella sp. W8]|uniref:1,4-beta-xylanase n=1 Tax=Lewinella sp. W8 TaxID=2528208 RepID=UPI0010684642|nr:1,4-beta-xylanase [Lewinella sp. W8]MTB50926.1 1,4-beta-xylanase [Lewinella sp. W8]